MIEAGHPALSVRRQCELLGLSRSSLYYEPGGEAAEDLRLMRRIDEQYTARPYIGDWAKPGAELRGPPRVRWPGP